MTSEHWHWRTSPRSGPTVIFDLDGVISDASQRQHFLRDGRRDWDGFFLAAVDDEVIDEGRRLAAAIAADHLVVILTARPDDIRAITIDWLDRHEIRADLLVVRPPGDRRSSAGYKRDELTALRAHGLDIRLALDDDVKIVDMYRSEGVATQYIHSGYYEA